MAYLRVKDNGTGHHLSVPEEMYEGNKNAFTLLKSPAEYPDGRPVEPKYHTSAATPAAEKSGQKADTKKESS